MNPQLHTMTRPSKVTIRDRSKIFCKHPVCSATAEPITEADWNLIKNFNAETTRSKFRMIFLRVFYYFLNLEKMEVTLKYFFYLQCLGFTRKAPKSQNNKSISFKLVSNSISVWFFLPNLFTYRLWIAISTRILKAK